MRLWLALSIVTAVWWAINYEWDSGRRVQWKDAPAIVSAGLLWFVGLPVAMLATYVIWRKKRLGNAE